MSRLDSLRAGSARVATMAAAIRAAAGSNSRSTVCSIRIQPDGITAYDWRPDRLVLSAEAAQAISDLMHSARPDIDWSVAHDYHLLTGMLRRSPAAGERGHSPETEGTFGGTDPVFLPPAAETARIEAA